MKLGTIISSAMLGKEE